VLGWTVKEDITCGKEFAVLRLDCKTRYYLWL